jgi:arylsulfatase A-like enzyme
MAELDRRATLGALASLPLAQGAVAATRRGSSARRPNILLIVSDQQRSWVDLPDRLPLPALSALRRAGTGYRNHYSHTAPCAPARAVLYTGRHTQANGVVANPGSGESPDLSPDIPTLGTMLRASGYRTFYKGKWHLSTIKAQRQGALFATSRDALEPYGFSDYTYDGDPTGYAWTGYTQDAAIAADAVALLDRLDRDEAAAPWFCAVNFVNPHDIMFFDATGEQSRTRTVSNLISPLKGAPPAAPYLDAWDLPLPRSFADTLADKPEAHRLEAAYLDLVYGKMPKDDLRAWRANQSYYFNCIRDLDSRLGQVLTAVRARPALRDNTIIVFTSDHGERAGAHGLRQKGGDIYKENLRVPLIITHPDARGGVETDALSSTVDLAPTLLGFAGADASAWPDLPGVDLGATVGDRRARTARDQRGILFNYEVRAHWSLEKTAERLKATAAGRQPTPDPAPFEGDRVLLRGLHDGRFKFARYFRPDAHHTPRDLADLRARNDLELYDTQADPDEMRNIAGLATALGDVERLMTALNALVALEVGLDDGTVFRRRVG